MSEQRTSNVLLVGLGSIGSVYAFILERSGRAKVTAVARSNYELYSNGKVSLNTEKFGSFPGWRPHRLVRSVREALADNAQYDFCVTATKCLPDVTPTSTLLKDAISSGQIGAWALIQNGLDVEKDLYQAIRDTGTPIISNLAWIGIMTSPDGGLVNWRGRDILVSGIYPPPARPIPASPSSSLTNGSSTNGADRVFTPREQEALALWTDLLTTGGAAVRTTDHVTSVRYAKNIWNCAWSSIQGLSRTFPSTFASLPYEVTEPLRKLIREVVDVGFAAGLLKEGDKQYNQETPMGDAASVADFCWTAIVEMSVANAAKGGGHKMSLWVDVEMDRPFEVEVITGGVVRLAKQVGVATPLLDYTYALLKGLQGEILLRRNAAAKI